MQGKFRTRPFIGWGVATFVVLACAGPAGAATVPAGFTETVIASGLSSPTAMQFAPDGRLFVCEQGGRLRVIKDGTLLPTPFTTISVDSSGERGLLGVAFDPAFLTTPYVYVYYTTTTPTVHNRISRFTANGDVAVPGSEVVILELDRLYATNHNGGALAFGADGKLYAAVGEGGVPSDAQSMTTLMGKMLRLNKDGSIPADNPFYSSTTGNRRAIWALGLRNPFTFAFNPSGAEMFINDVGQNTWEEINDGIAGANYGWPTTEGPTTQFDGPRYAYNHSSGTTCAITGGAFYSPLSVRFPSEYFNDYFFADYCAGWIRKLDPAAGNAVVTFATGISSPVDLKVSDDGGLYYLARGTGSSTGVVRRIDYGAAAPGITSHPVSRTTQPGVSVTFSVRASGAPVLRYQWQRDGVNVAGATAEDYSLTATQSDNGARFRAVVSNDAGSVTSNEAVLTVSANQTPTAIISQPAAGALYSGGSVITYSGSGTDPEQGTLPAAALTWRVDFHHDVHTHPFIAPTTGAAGGSFTIPTTGHTESNVWYRIYLTVEDSGGLTHTTHRDIMPRVVRLTLATNPAGLQLNLDGQPVVTPYAFDSIVGIVRDFEATTPQMSGGTTYAFGSWSDGGSARHAISTPAANTTYSATYNAGGGGNPALRAGYGFNDGSGTSASDASGNGATGAITGASWTASGRFGGALSFDGTDDRVTVGATSALNLTTGTVQAWVRVDTLGRWHGVIAKGNANSDPAHNYAIEITNGNLVNCVIGNGSSANVVTSTTQVAALQFYHLACTWDGAQLRLYINGVLNRSVSQTVTPAANSSPLYIGQYGGNVDRLDGVIDEVRLYNVALSQTQIQSDLNTPVGTVEPPTDTTPPAVSLTSPAGGALVAGAITLAAAASDNSGTVADVQFFVDGVPVGGPDTSAPFSAGWATGGSANGAHVLTARATDAAGNQTTSPPISVTVDNLAPSVSIGSPSGGTVSGTVTVTGNASDNSGIASVQFRVGGVAIGAPDTTAPYGVSWTTSSVANGSHVLTAVATDLAGNQTTSAGVTVTVSNGWAAPSGLVAAYTFAEGSGGTTADVSGNGNTGTLTGGPGWSSSGRFGTALSFDGLNDLVSIADAPSIDLTSGMTIEAWVNPAALSGWRTVAMKEMPDGLDYALYASNGPRPAGYLNTTGSTMYVSATGPSALTTGAWSHLAVTFGGGTLRLYVNGVQVASQTGSGTIRTSASPLTIGGNSVWSEWFVGLIDEVRIYNRALTQAEIQAGMSQTLGGG
jgi:glucose/arabinose dehydrogenase